LATLDSRCSAVVVVGCLVGFVVEFWDQFADELDASGYLVIGDAADLVQAHESVDAEVGIGWAAPSFPDCGL
jgi:hypothetical protein